MDTHLFPILFLLSISMFTASDALEAVITVTNDFTSGNTVELKFVYKNKAGGVPFAKASAKAKVTNTISFTNDDKPNTIACKCLVTEVGNFRSRYTIYYGFFQVSTSHLRRRILDVSVNEDGAFIYTESGGKQPLHAWLKQQFYVYNLFENEVKLRALSGVSSWVETGKYVKSGQYLHWTRIVNEHNIRKKITYKCRVFGVMNGTKIIEVYDTSSLDVSLLKKLRTLSYKYAVKEAGIGLYNPETSEYTHLRDWPSS